MPTKDDTARTLADAHFRLDHALTRIFRIVEADEANPARPVKLLEVCSQTAEVGISPVGMNADPARGVPYPSVIIEVSPREFEQLQRDELSLPNGWRLGEELFPRAVPTRAAS